MGATEHLAIVQLGEADTTAGVALSTEAGWNQNEADWRFFLTRGIVFGMRDREQKVVATAALLSYADRDAWISMVLVTESWRRKGLATRLVDACINTAAKRGVTAWLDATPAGAEVYRPLGFTPTIQLRRLRRAPSAISGSKLAAGRLGDLLTLDISAMGFSRRDLLREFCERRGSQLYSNGDAIALIRDGRTARHIGPVFAKDAAHALAIVGNIAASEAGPLLIDAVASQEPFLKGLTEAGWSIERPFQRMRFGRARIKADKPKAEALPFAVAGPEFG
jgi:GNAT superfamily N-acetyltransferase